MDEIFFWLSLILLFYTFIGYPVLLLMAAIFYHNRVKKSYITPKITIVVTVHNEVSNIENRINNLLSQNYPKDLLSILVVSDGSQDNTVDIARGFDPRCVQIMEIKERVGKAEALNRAIPLCRTDIVILADARQRFDENAVKELVANFSDERVGAVSGELCFETADKTGVGEGLDFYWKYDKFLRKNESKLYSTVGATGAIYAIRKSLFKPIDSDVLLDDVMIPMNIVMQGYRCIFEPKAKAYDVISSTQEEEERRKIRTIAGNFQMFFRYGNLLNPLKNPVWFQAFSHKFLRIIAPFFIVTLFIFNVLLAKNNILLAALGFQAVFYLCALSGYFTRKKKHQSKIFAIPYGFLMLNIFTIMASLEFIFRKPLNIWGKD